MQVQQQIDACLRDAFSPEYLLLENESHMHSVPPGSESHFRAVIVSEAFAGLRPVQRHQAVYRALGDIMGRIHALALQTLTAAEWQTAELHASPECLGGSRKGEPSHGA